jgi:hypothetical protein
LLARRRMTVNNFEDIAAALSDNEYKRRRLDPVREDIAYLSMRDLRDAIKSVETDAPIKLLDYGCGDSPYRSLFPRADYKRADYVHFPGLDYQLDANSRVPELDSQFDLILSTQVLEHVVEPATLLTECFRLLKPGGKLFLTTHGTYEDHGCPYDYTRWTADGLKLMVSRAGFEQIAVQKQTTGPRALCFLVMAYIGSVPIRGSVFTRIPLKILRRIYISLRPAIFRYLDHRYASCCCVDANEPGHPFYLNLSVTAIRPK